ncbi:VOC family protein [Pseudotamlana carrageenivorans]|uniref:Glyoxalase/bleomycin resistance/extradiol dioxygenase family protein n=1 Tax=Pseudotamlana carrageenivorans TaxID=2069432 RepID=A0A2I7SLY8_9FLAO|nr:VOC family protein [Tamlana carrageenivorans]AUS06925.1 glyoxalase/bleomycin resistance/extradiol dioxygenase family protein [Tamlana carrageenivorans]
MNLNQVTVPSLNVAKSVAFYKTLGLKLIVFTHSKYTRFECPDGDATFSIHQVERLSDNSGIMVYFEEQNLDETVEYLINKGMEFNQLPTDRSWLWREAQLNDPDGNRIILYHAGKNRKNPPRRLA